MSINRAFNRLVGGQERVEAASDDAFRSAPAREREEGRSKSDCRRRKRVDRLPVLTVRPANVWRLCGRADRARAQPAFRRRRPVDASVERAAGGPKWRARLHIHAHASIFQHGIVVRGRLSTELWKASTLAETSNMLSVPSSDSK